MVKQFDANQLMAPKVIPENRHNIEEAAPPPDTGMGVVGGAGDAGGAAGGVLGGVLGGVPGAPPPPPPPPKPKARRARSRIGGNVQEANLIRKVSRSIRRSPSRRACQGTVDSPRSSAKMATFRI